MAISGEVPPQTKTTLSIFNLVHAFFVIVGTVGGILLRIYFTHGGDCIWLSTLVLVGAWPLNLIPLSLSSRKVHLSLSMYLVFAVLGVLFALDCYVYAISVAYMPVSTSSIIVSSQLAFTAVFAFLVVRQRFTPYSFNAVVIMTLGSIVLSMGANSDRPKGESNGKYILGFVMSVATAALIALIFVLMELAMKKGKVAQTYASAMEMQLVMGIAGTVFCLVGMAINKDFQVIPREAREFSLGKMKYYMILIWDTVFWQLVNIGLVGLTSGASSLFASMMIALHFPLLEILAVLFLRESLSGVKAVSFVLSIWGFVSYLYGEKRQSDKAIRSASDQVQELGAVA